MQVIIYRSDGYPSWTVEVTSQSYYHKELMKEEYFLLFFNLPDTGELSPYEQYYIEMFVPEDRTTRHFYLFEDLNPTRDHQASGWKYTCKFEAVHSYWKQRVFADPTNYDTEKDKYYFTNAWSITAKADVVFGLIVTQIMSIMKELGWQNTEWEYAPMSHDGKPDIPDEPRFFEFNGTTIWEALDMMAEAWDVEWWVEYQDDKKAKLWVGRCKLKEDSPMPIEDDSSIMSAADSDVEYITRIIPFGSTRNLPADYREDVKGGIERRLMLPQQEYPYNYIDAEENMNPQDIVERVVVFKDIFPRQQLTVKKVIPFPRPVEGSDIPFQAYRVTWNEDFPFRESWVLPDVELRIVFESGSLQGMDFAAMFNPDNRDETGKDGQIIEIVRNENYGIPVPNEDLKPGLTDKFVLYGFDATKALPTLVPQAEAELSERAKQYLKSNSIDPKVYSCKVNPIAYSINYDIGQTVQLFSVSIKGLVRNSRIQAIEHKIDTPRVCTYQVGDNPLRSRLKDAEKNISEIIYKESTKVNHKMVDEGDIHTENKYNPYNYLTAPQEVSVILTLPPYVIKEKTPALVYCGREEMQSLTYRAEGTLTIALPGLTGIPQDDIIAIQVCQIGTAGGSKNFLPSVRRVGDIYFADFKNTDDEKHSVGGVCYYQAFVRSTGGGKPPQGYELSLSGDGGMGNLTGGGVYPSGTTVQVSCDIVDEDYRFKAWTIDETIVSTSPSFSYTMPPQDVYMVATSVYTPVKYALTLVKGAGVTAVTGGGSYSSGEMVTVSATVAEANTFEAWFRDGERWEVADTFSFEMPSANVTLNAMALPFAVASANVLNVDASLIPSTDNTFGVGSSAKRFKEVYAGTGDFGDNLKVAGNATITGSLSAGSITAPLATSSTKGVISINITGSGNAIVNASVSNGVLTLTKGTISSNISVNTSGSGNVVSSISASGMTLNVNKGITAVTSYSTSQRSNPGNNFVYAVGQSGSTLTYQYADVGAILKPYEDKIAALEKRLAALEGKMR